MSFRYPPKFVIVIMERYGIKRAIIWSAQVHTIPYMDAWHAYDNDKIPVAVIFILLGVCDRLIDISLKTNESINSLVLSALKNSSQWINLNSHVKRQFVPSDDSSQATIRTKF